jgi:hypothetical protein
MEELLASAIFFMAAAGLFVAGLGLDVQEIREAKKQARPQCGCR